MSDTKLRIYNEFGITPTKNYEAAGFDFYVPDLRENVKEREVVMPLLAKSYKTDIETLYKFADYLNYLCAAKGFNRINQWMNLIHLYGALDTVDWIGDKWDYANMDVNCQMFVDDYLLVPFDPEEPVGLKLQVDDHILINSGIHVALDPSTAGIFFNKSGKGNKGFDVRACVVDEDYAGPVHLSLAYTKVVQNDGIFYCGDKIIQMVILPVIKKDGCEEITREYYDRLMSDSKRGAQGFGSSDEKH